jgi:hypothetical protein
MGQVGRRLCGILAVLAAASLASACVTFGGISRTTGTIDRSAGEARNDSILRNILRASQHEPLYFYSISRVSGSGMEDFKLNLPPFTLGPGRNAAQRSYTFGADILDSQRSGSFDVALLDSKNFYQGMLAPLDLLEINLLLKQGFPRELIYRLAVQDITIYDDQGLHRYVNDPRVGGPSPPIPLNASLADILKLSASRDFNLYFEAAMTHGITTETYSRLDSGADEGGDAKPPPASGARGPSPSGAKNGPAATTTAARLCFDQTLIETTNAIGNLSMTDVKLSGNLCGERPFIVPMAEASEPLPALQKAYDDCKALDAASKAPNSPAQHSNRFCARFGPQIMAVELNTRSLFGVFQYLGEVLNGGNKVQLWGLGGANESRATAGPLLQISNSRTATCFADVIRGPVRYCIPAKDAEALKETFSVINALQALKTSPGDLPATTAVRIEQ